MVLTHVATWMNLENDIPSEGTQSQNTYKNYTISFSTKYLDLYEGRKISDWG